MLNYNLKKFSKQTKQYDPLVQKEYKFRAKTISPKRVITSDDAKKELRKVQVELYQSKLQQDKSTKKLTSSFLTFSRENQDKNTLRPTNVDSPSSTRYNPKLDLIMPRIRVTLLRSSSTVPRKSKVHLPPCTENEELICKYPHKIVNTERSHDSRTSYIDADVLNEKIKNRRENLSPARETAGLISFEKQTSRTFENKQAEITSLDKSDYFPTLYGKFKRVPAYDFGKASPRKTEKKEILPEYSWSEKLIRKPLDKGIIDMSKGSDRFANKTATTFDSINKDKVMVAVNMLLPHSKASSPDFNKSPSREVTSKMREMKQRAINFDFL
ncbi:unnamed protein product [Blepharisma stoltei]|uniref:Uncharacterized protein n=1 Tax=Blepharisma stoltei TaxID=1481888 RepID=A0AAU9J4E5_9CILI|nr:unnamed protein product [Blepharisma stoltei]